MKIITINSNKYLIQFIQIHIFIQNDIFQMNQSAKRLKFEELDLPTIPNSLSLAILIIGTLLLFLIIILNIVIDTPLFIQGINFIYNYQHSQPYGWIQVIENLFSLLCEPVAIGVILVIYYIIVNRKLLLIVHLSYFLFTTYIIALLKQSFQQSRPIWYDSRISNWQWFCPKDFGNPSGHSFAVILLYEPILSDSISYGGKYRPLSFILVLLMVMVPISRMYLGVHSANQILFGLSMGTIFLILYKYIYQRALYELFWKFFLGQKKVIKFIGVIIVNILTVIIPIIFYQVNHDQRPMLQKDIDNLNNQCGTSLTGAQVQSQMLDACCIGCVAFGLIYGFMRLMNAQGYKKYLLGLWAYESYPKIIIKIGIYIISAGLPFLPFFLIAYFAVKNVPIVHYLLYCLAVTLAGFGLAYFAPIIAYKCNIMRMLPDSKENNHIQSSND